MRIRELLHDDFIHPSGSIKARSLHQQVERQRFRRMNGLPVRDSDDPAMGAWVESAIERNGERTSGRWSAPAQVLRNLGFSDRVVLLLQLDGAVSDCGAETPVPE